MEIEALLARSGHGVESMADGVTKVTVDLGQGRSAHLLAFHQPSLALDDERLVRLCGHSGLSLDDPDLFLLLEQAASFAVGGFMTPEPGGSILFTYTTYVEGLEPDVFALLCSALAWTVYAMQRGEQRGAPPEQLTRVTTKGPALDVRALLVSPDGRPLFAERQGGLALLVRIDDEGRVAFRAPVDGEEDDGEAVELRIVTTDIGLLGEPLVLVCTPLAQVEGPKEVAAQLARRLIELNAHVPVGKFFATEERLVLFGHTALARVLSKARLHRILALIAETALAVPGELGGEVDEDEQEGGA